MNYNKHLKSYVNLKKAVDFHGHLGPYLVLGILMGDLALERLKCKKHFEMEAMIKGALTKPRSCLIDGIQVSTGCTYGKGNIKKIKGKEIQLLFHNLENNRRLKISLRKELIKRLDRLKGHKDSENFAKELYRINPLNIFNITPIT